MLCYKDQTFCGFYNKCENGNTCERALTEEIILAARNAGLGVSQFMFAPQGCFKPKTKEENQDES